MTAIAAGWVTAPATRAVISALEASGHLAYFVGGCVRNALLDAPTADIDIATDALPAATLAAAEAAGLKAVPTGIEHGTITVVADGEAFEVTTFRRDVATDGRRAVVAFSDRLEDDAARRDFTMNAIYATSAGRIIDPVGGLEDLLTGRLRFIGNAADRIAEDYLRILRFFRFHAWYADPDGGIDADALAACAAGADGIERLSAERVGHEMRRLAAASDPAPAIAAMAHAGVLARVLPGADPSAMAALVALEPELSAAPDPLRRLAALGGADPSDRLRLSRAETRALATLREGIASHDAPEVLAYRHGHTSARDIVLLRAALTGQPLAAHMASRLDQGANATFPLRALDLMPDLQGAELGTALRAREEAWIESGFRLTRKELLAKP